MRIRVPVRALVAALAATVSIAVPVRAEDTSPWKSDAHSQLRLLAGSRSGGMLLGGLAIQLDPGWKTYWRTPGDSGVPPRFDFSKSENIEAVTVLWPAPKPFDDGAGGQSLGYRGSVVIPLRIAARNADRPVILRASVSYAVCEKICIPVEADAELAFTSVASAQDAALFAALDTVPKPVRIGDAVPLAIRDVRREGSEVVVDVEAPDGVSVSLFVEGPTPDWALPVPKLRAMQGSNGLRFAFALDGLPPGARPEGAALKFTLAGPDSAYEFNTNLN